MPRKEGQKLKLLTLLEIFVRETDEKHPISVPRMVELLKERGIVAERKSVYDDIQTLNEMPDTPFEIVQQRGRGGGYYMVDTPFELAELKLLVDAVYASKFITARKRAFRFRQDHAAALRQLFGPGRGRHYGAGRPDLPFGPCAPH